MAVSRITLATVITAAHMTGVVAGGVPMIDKCGCRPGLGWSVTTGRGCCKADSVTQVLAAAPRQDTRGNMDHSASSTDSATSYPDQCGRTAGFG